MENKDIILYILIGLVLLSLLNTFILQNKVHKIMKKINLEDNKKTNTTTFTPTSKPEKFTSSETVENYSSDFSKTGTKKIVTIDADGNLDSFEFPRGVIVAWAGAYNNIPDGWQLCDGRDGTPDLRGRFILSQNQSQNGSGSYPVGQTGGQEKVTLTINEMPSHTHDYSIPNNMRNVDGSGGTTVYQPGTGILTSTLAGGGQAHENMPPYFALCYIMKL